MTTLVDGDEEVRWSQVEDSFFVGNCRGNFVGYIDQDPDGTFAIYDRMSSPQGESESLEDAIARLNGLYFSGAREGESNVSGH